MNVPFVDLKTQYLSIKEEIQKEINEVLDSTAFICGRKVKKFEEDFARLHEVKHCIGLSSGTDALHVALTALGIKQGDEVIVPVNTFIATSEAVSLCGARPIFVDHDEKTYNIDVSKIEKVINGKTRAIIPVHLYGQPSEMDPILELASKYGLFVIEDCSQAHLAAYRGKKVGGFGHTGTFSFYPGKNLGAYGEAGAVVTNDDELYDKMLRFRQHGSIQKYIHDSEGHNYRMEELQAAVLNVKLKHITRWTQSRRRVASEYSKNLSSVNSREPITPYSHPAVEHAYHLYIINTPRRDELSKYLAERGVQTALHYPIPLHLQKAYSYLKYKLGDFPTAEKYCNRILSIPMFPELTDDQIRYVSDSIKNFFD